MMGTSNLQQNYGLSQKDFARELRKRQDEAQERTRKERVFASHQQKIGRSKSQVQIKVAPPIETQFKDLYESLQRDRYGTKPIPMKVKPVYLTGEITKNRDYNKQLNAKKQPIYPVRPIKTVMRLDEEVKDADKAVKEMNLYEKELKQSLRSTMIPNTERLHVEKGVIKDSLIKRIPDAFTRKKYIGSKLEVIQNVNSDDESQDEGPELLEEERHPKNSKLFDIIVSAKRKLKC